MIQKLHELHNVPDEVQASFGLKLSAEAGKVCWRHTVVLATRSSARIQELKENNHASLLSPHNFPGKV